MRHSVLNAPQLRQVLRTAISGREDAVVSAYAQSLRANRFVDKRLTDESSAKDVRIGRIMRFDVSAGESVPLTHRGEHVDGDERATLRPPQSRREVFADVIAKSKAAKYERQAQAEEQNALIQQLDGAFEDVRRRVIAAAANTAADDNATAAAAAADDFIAETMRLQTDARSGVSARTPTADESALAAERKRTEKRMERRRRNADGADAERDTAVTDFPANTQKRAEFVRALSVTVADIPSALISLIDRHNVDARADNAAALIDLCDALLERVSTILPTNTAAAPAEWTNVLRFINAAANALTTIVQRIDGVTSAAGGIARICREAVANLNNAIRQRISNGARNAADIITANDIVGAIIIVSAFPRSDRRHNVVGPIRIAIANALSAMQIRNGKDSAVALFAAQLLMETITDEQTNGQVNAADSSADATNRIAGECAGALHKVLTALAADDEERANAEERVLSVRCIFLRSDDLYFGTNEYARRMRNTAAAMTRALAASYAALSAAPELIGGLKDAIVVAASKTADAALFSRTAAELDAAISRAQRFPLRHSSVSLDRTIAPAFIASYQPGRDYDADTERRNNRALLRKSRREARGALAEVRKDAAVIRREETRRINAFDAEIKAKRARIRREFESESRDTNIANGKRRRRDK